MVVVVMAGDSGVVVETTTTMVSTVAMTMMVVVVVVVTSKLQDKIDPFTMMKDLKVFFLSETKLDSHRMERIRIILRYGCVFTVPIIGSHGPWDQS